MRILIYIDEKKGSASIVSVTGTGESPMEPAIAIACESSARNQSSLYDYIALAAWIPLGALMALWLTLGIITGSLFRHWDNSQVSVLSVLSIAVITTTFYLWSRIKLIHRNPFRPWQAASMTILSIVTLTLFFILIAGAD